MELETINRLYLELSQIATARTRREIEAEKLIRTIGTTADEETLRLSEAWLAEFESPFKST